MESLAYLLCVLTALSCGALLLNRYRGVRVSLLTGLLLGLISDIG